MGAAEGGGDAVSCVLMPGGLSAPWYWPTVTPDKEQPMLVLLQY